MPKCRRIDEAREREWESHKPTIVRLYWEEKKPLREVMTIMESWPYNFSATYSALPDSASYQLTQASKYEYETRLKGWNIYKNANRSTWIAIAPHIRRLDQAGKPWEVRVNGQLKSPDIVKREIDRYAPAMQVAGAEVLPKLPKGVTILEILPSNSPFVWSKLPFQEFEDSVRIQMASLLLDDRVHVYPYTGTLDPATINSIGSAIENSLKPVVPWSTRMGQNIGLTFSSRETHLFATTLHRSVLFSVANNFAGIAAAPKGLVIEFLQRMTAQEVLHEVLFMREFHTARALALNIFRAAIEVGNADLVDFFLKQSLPDIGVNKLVCANENGLWTPVEKAASLCHINVVKVLLAHGADVNLSDPRRGCVHGALDCAIHDIDLLSTGNGRISELDPKLVVLLLTAGARLSLYNLDLLISCDDRGEFARILMPICISSQLQRWCRNGLLFETLRNQGTSTFRKTLEIMLDHQVDPNLASPSDKRFVGGFVGTLVHGARTLIDVVSSRGCLDLVQRLVHAGAKLTDDTLPCAIMSGDLELVDYLLHNGGDVHRMGSDGWSPLAAALHCRNPCIRQLIVQRHDPETLKERASFQSALHAAILMQNEEWIVRLVRAAADVVPRDLGLALTLAVKWEQRDLALSLIDVGADTNTKSRTLGRNNHSCGPPIVDATIHCDIALVHALLDAGADPNLCDGLGLWTAVWKGSHTLA